MKFLGLYAIWLGILFIVTPLGVFDIYLQDWSRWSWRNFRVSAATVYFAGQMFYSLRLYLRTGLR